MLAARPRSMKDAGLLTNHVEEMHLQCRAKCLTVKGTEISIKAMYNRFIQKPKRDLKLFG
jgi:hypothetical protein